MFNKKSVWKSSNLISVETDMIAILPYAILGGVFFVVGFFGAYIRLSYIYNTVISEFSLSKVTAICYLLLYIYIWTRIMNFGIVIILLRYFDINNTKLTLGSETLNGNIGLLRTVPLKLPLKQIEKIYVEKSFFGKLLNYEMIIVNTNDKTYTFDYIKSAGSFVEKVMEKNIEKKNDTGSSR